MACWERPPQKYVIGRDEPWVCLDHSTRMSLFADSNGSSLVRSSQSRQLLWRMPSRRRLSYYQARYFVARVFFDECDDIDQK